MKKLTLPILFLFICSSCEWPSEQRRRKNIHESQINEFLRHICYFNPYNEVRHCQKKIGKARTCYERRGSRYLQITCEFFDAFREKQKGLQFIQFEVLSL